MISEHSASCWVVPSSPSCIISNMSVSWKLIIMTKKKTAAALSSLLTCTLNIVWNPFYVTFYDDDVQNRTTMPFLSLHWMHCKSETEGCHFFPLPWTIFLAAALPALNSQPTPGSRYFSEVTPSERKSLWHITLPLNATENVPSSVHPILTLNGETKVLFDFTKSWIFSAQMLNWNGKAPASRDERIVIKENWWNRQKFQRERGISISLWLHVGGLSSITFCYLAKQPVVFHSHYRDLLRRLVLCRAQVKARGSACPAETGENVHSVESIQPPCLAELIEDIN